MAITHNYDNPKVQHVINDRDDDVLDDFSDQDWLDLAAACADQAGLSPHVRMAIKLALSDGENDLQWKEEAKKNDACLNEKGWRDDCD